MRSLSLNFSHLVVRSLSLNFIWSFWTRLWCDLYPWALVTLLDPFNGTICLVVRSFERSFWIRLVVHSLSFIFEQSFWTSLVRFLSLNFIWSFWTRLWCDLYPWTLVLLDPFGGAIFIFEWFLWPVWCDLYPWIYLILLDPFGDAIFILYLHLAHLWYNLYPWTLFGPFGPVWWCDLWILFGPFGPVWWCDLYFWMVLLGLFGAIFNLEFIWSF